MNLDTQFQIGSHIGWEVEQADEELKNVAESHILAFSLQRSRQQWLTSVLPKFSGKPRKSPKYGPDASIPPPHTLYARGSCDVQIGPHIFSNTTIYEAHYLPSTVTQKPPVTTSYTNFAASSSSALPSSLMLNPVEPTMATPAFIDQINTAAASNPILAHLLQLATAGKADQTQMQMLSMTLKSLANNPTSALQYAQLNSQNSATSVLYSPAFPFTATEPGKEFDLVFQFQESPSERFILPRGTALCERIFKNSNDSNIVISAYAPLQRQFPTAGGAYSNEPRLFRMTLRGASDPIWDSLNRWGGGEERKNESKKLLDKLKQRQSRNNFLAYRLPAGPLLDQFKASTISPYTSKSMKPSSAPSRPRRIRKVISKESSMSEVNAWSSKSAATTTAAKMVRRKRSVDEIDENMDAAMNLAAAITGAANSATLTTSVSLTALSATPSTPELNAPLPKKHRKRMSAPGSKSRSTATEIMCRSCQAKDVPLMLGGRFCRPCVEAGRAIDDIPLAPNYAARNFATHKSTYDSSPASANKFTDTSSYHPVSSSLIPGPRSTAAAALDVSYPSNGIDVRNVSSSGAGVTWNAQPSDS
ncbi:hypothetical protein GYMLUDRAFT_32795 [Collybiopsis luxurians FD-317 M1]|nr:hypothetical protein GYMLUDRAFT_32795 [Collybiopsis luxurians FD-317 M1]